VNKFFLLFLSIWIISCGGGGSSTSSNSQQQNIQQQDTQPATITFKTVPDNIGIFN
tara:strand:- start:1943 stop:2110 length:168 start_codon:yes stop_codon:yes gene_type:complete